MEQAILCKLLVFKLLRKVVWLVSICHQHIQIHKTKKPGFSAWLLRFMNLNVLMTDGYEPYPLLQQPTNQQLTENRLRHMEQATLHISL